MRNTKLNLPSRLRIGSPLPKSFQDIMQGSEKYPRYKIVVFSTDSYDRTFRIVHAYYIWVLDTDPSRLQTFMRSRAAKATTGWEDGRQVEAMMGYREYMKIDEMLSFNGQLVDLVKDNSTAYTMIEYHNVVQYSGHKGYGTVIVYSSNPI